MYDAIIIGAGPGGLNTALYLGRSGLKTLVIEKEFSGGQMIKSNEIENYIGFENINGAMLSMEMDKHAKKFGAEFISDEVTEIKLDEIKIVKTKKNFYECKTIIFAMGSNPRNLGVAGEDKYKSGGISYCATCDGAFYRGKDVAVIGGGNTAVEDAIYLANFCKNVYIIHRRDEYRAEKALVDTLIATDNIIPIYNGLTEEILGSDGRVTGVKVKDKYTNEEKIIEVNGIFIAVGATPNTRIVPNEVELDEGKYIITDKYMETNIDGVFAVGDIRDTPLRQIITAASDGAIAAQYVNAYIMKH